MIKREISMVSLPYEGHIEAGKGHYSRQTFQEFTQAFDIPLIQHYEKECDPALTYAGDKWYGGLQTIDQAKKLVAQGWVDGVRRIRMLGRQLLNEIPPAKSMRRRQAWLEEGDSLDVDKVFASSDKPYRGTFKREATGPRDVSLVGIIGGSARRGADELFWQGACAAVLSDLLEDAGYSVRLSGADCVGGSFGGCFVNETVLKDYSEPLRLDTVAAVLAHAGIYRTFGFRNICQQPVKVDSSLGRSLRNPSSAGLFMETYGMLEPGAIVLNSAFTEKEALTEIRRVLNKLNTGEQDE